jgi:hypothetical protein
VKFSKLAQKGISLAIKHKSWTHGLFNVRGLQCKIVNVKRKDFLTKEEEQVIEAILPPKKHL